MYKQYIPGLGLRSPGYEAKVHALPLPEEEVPEGVLPMDQLPVLAGQARSQD